MPEKRLRNICISLFVILWTLVFHYESLRAFYLEPFFARPLPKVKFLFPPAGWIMFFNVDDQFGCVEVYGMRLGAPQRIDPHDILQTRTVGYDNIHRNVLSEVLDPSLKESFCGLLKRKFPEFDAFIITEVEYPSLTRAPHLRIEKAVTQCPGK